MPTCTVLGDLVDLVVGFPFSSKSYATTGEGRRLLRGDNIGQGFLRWENAARWEGDADPRYELRAGDLVLAMDRPWVGAGLKFATLREADTPALLVQRVARLRARAGVDQRYLHYLVGSKEFTDHVLAVQTGTAVPHISGTQIQAFRAPQHSVSEQKAIGEVLGAIDDKIAANQDVATGALRLADAEYMQLKGPSSGLAILGDVAVTVLGGTPSRSRPEFWTDGTVPWIASGKANETLVLEPTEFITEEALAKSAAKLMPARATVVAITGATLGQVARLEISTSGNQSLVGIWSEDRAVNDWLYFAVRHEMDELLKHATGAAQQHVNKAAVDGLTIPWPHPRELSAWGDVVRPLLDLAAAVDRESLVLARTRDELLPLLMSGKVRVKDVEKSMEEVS